MRTITMLAYRRPEYVSQAMMALGVALEELVAHRGESKFDKLIVSVDGGHEKSAATAAACEQVAGWISGLIDVEVVAREKNLGVTNHPFFTISQAFIDCGSDFNVHLEDDAVVSPDALFFSLWFEEFASTQNQYALGSFCNHGDFGRAVRKPNPGDIPDDPTYVAECAKISSPFAWCVSRKEWEWIGASWGNKVIPPTGWDWSLTLEMRLRMKKSLHPVVSRCKNIGRLEGTHGAPETFDIEQAVDRYSSGSDRGPFKLVARIPDEQLAKRDAWMLPELANRGV